MNLLDTVMTSLEIGNAGASGISLGSNLSLGGSSVVSAQVQVISPPTIGIGEGGTDASGNYRTQASNAQIGVYLLVDLGNNSIPILYGTLLGGLLRTIISVDVQLPIYIQVANAKAVLNSTSCQPTAAASNAVITATPGVAYVCIGNPTLSGGKLSLTSISNTSYNSTTVCQNPATLINTSVLLGAVSVVGQSTAIQIPVQANPTSHTFYGLTGTDSSSYWTSNTNALGTALSNALAGLSASKISVTVGVLFGLIQVQVATDTVSTLLSVITAIVTPLLNAVNSLLVPLLNVLGVQVGAATVHQISLSCGVSQTVY